jgi:serine phosphatase RsbU (regulator of sigma subunit)
MEIEEKYLDKITETIYSLLKGEIPPLLQLPDNFPQNELFQVYEYFNKLINEYFELSNLIYALARGELDYQSPKSKLKVTQSFKSLQSNLKHLTWKTQQIANGDFNQKVDFMGDFSLAFNKMVNQLKDSFQLIEDKNHELNVFVSEITQKNIEIEKYNHNITASIVYARNIQNALIPSQERLNIIFDENFVFYLPRDIVSGDFYWIKEINNKILFALADCTGHGVPGAFMSLLGISLLNEITAGVKIENPAEILGLLRHKIINSFQKSDKSKTQDGMDISLILLDLENNFIEFSGANQSIIIIQNNKFNVHQGDKMPIGYYFSKTNVPFTNYKFSINKNDIVYLFTDGIIDQFGGNHGRKFTKIKLFELLTQISKNDLQTQLEIIKQEFAKWQGKHAQVDDICLIGIKI